MLFNDIPVAEVCTYLQDDELNVTSEDEVLVAVQRWLSSTKASTTVKEGSVQNVFPCVRLRFCSRSALESLSIDETTPPMMQLKILQHLQHGLHGEGTARKSYSAAHEAMAALTIGSSASASAPTSARRKSPMVAPVRPKPSPQEHVLIMGGFKANEEPHKNIVFVDKKGDDSILAEAPMCVHSGNCSVCTTGNGLIFSGGYDKAIKRSVSKVQIFSLSNRSWRHLPDMLRPVQFHGVAYLDEHFYTFGGCYKEDAQAKNAYSDVNVLDLQSQSWSHCQPLPCTTLEPGVAVVGNDILVIGGYSADDVDSVQTNKYNIKTQKRTRCRNMPKYGHVHQSTVAVDNLIYVLCHDMFLQYNVRADQWSELPLPLPKERRWLRAMVHTQGCLRGLGGYTEDNNHPTDSVLSYNISSKKWTLEKKRMPIAVAQSWAFTVVM